MSCHSVGAEEFSLLSKPIYSSKYSVKNRAKHFEMFQSAAPWALRAAIQPGSRLGDIRRTRACGTTEEEGGGVWWGGEERREEEFGGM